MLIQKERAIASSGDKFKFTIRVNQVYRQKFAHNFQVLIAGKREGGWIAKVLTTKPNVFRGTHRLCDRTIRKHYELVN